MLLDKIVKTNTVWLRTMTRYADNEAVEGLPIKTKTGTVLISDWSDLINLDEAVRLSGLSRRQFDRLVSTGWAPQPVEHYKYKMFVKWEIDGWRIARELRKVKPIIDEMRDKIQSVDICNDRYVKDYHARFNIFSFMHSRLSDCEKIFVDDQVTNTHGVYSRKRDYQKYPEKDRGEYFCSYWNGAIRDIKYGPPTGTGALGSYGYSSH